MAHVKSSLSNYEARLVAKGLGLTDEQVDEFLDSHFEQLRFVRTTTLEKVKQDIQSLELLSVV